ncbi:CopG family ribbon-helix-helix protein [Sulfobacillus thermosulfidooxidans]|uniref:CopG family transcriptional regulator / antitoxin EndoAI n=1 Tax=Sulfobacillus thermosulfidooxidans (strain DSM 9293 / VKM B-1269 / AT-1) TaxID=929705 RepID=A0A1W1WGI7_SULTA|nr:ribbon-helix-helix protein, CopG family [Sulfobacillus thermosulfidooxidans]OLZ10007.1 CopG family transcriptional regulator [Sulfobacillus thermosulfidooxidans]OLZ15688.1 CopG family transcriptional regulator [Sulfobacillus thermosulfidooxidans]OLZ18466.1 CopG family transcriptional regulator [Sulfobacillus thermosulfidooxidans]SMC05418.1 CopG family transcriptional regulator / antitoxin EndoAI [Sulfobacillus thermosulfidooxidans DSM 9293]
MGILEENRRVIVRLPHHLVDALDKMADGEGRHRSEVIRESVEFYLAEQRKQQLRQELIQGYQELGSLNAALAEEHWEYAGYSRE